jgi:predicted AAA+ superfamily ATPase
MEIKILAEHNPWWNSGKVDALFKGRKRKDYEIIIKSAKIREITIITGVRRSGKSTLMYQIIDSLLEQGIKPEQILLLNLEDPKLDKENLDEIYSSYKSSINPKEKSYILLDEIQRKEAWERWIRKHYDMKTECKFIISGSCSYLLKKEYSTLLTGRNITFEVFPLSFNEYLEFKNIDTSQNMMLEKDTYQITNALTEYIEKGGFPNIFFTDPQFKTKILMQYFDDIIYKDIIDRHNLSSSKTRDLAIYLMTNITGKISLRSIRNTLGLSYESIKEYVAHYIEAFLFFRLEHFSYSIKEQKTRSSKIYCIDTGIRNAVSFKFSKDEGKLAENIVMVELKRRGEEIFYWNDTGSEVDFIIKNKDNNLTAINVTFTDNITSREEEGLINFKHTYKKAARLILITKNTEKKENSIEYIPLGKWLMR